MSKDKVSSKIERELVKWSAMTWDDLIKTYHMLEAMKSPFMDEAWDEIEKRVRSSRNYSPSPTFYGPAWMKIGFLRLISHQWAKN